MRGPSAAVSFAIGLLVANVPEGLLPMITLALAVGVREMAQRGALVKRLSAVETRAWGFLGLISASLVLAGFFLTLRHAGWHPGAATGPGTPLNHAYRQATTVAWLGIVACQIGTAFAVRTDHASLRSVGVFANRFLLAGIAAALAFAAALIYLPALQGVFGTAALTPAQVAIVAPFPFIVWGADEIRRLLLRRYRASRGGSPTS